MNCPIKDKCEYYTSVCQFDCEEYDKYQKERVNEIRELWKKAHPKQWIVFKALLLMYLVLSFLCVLQVFGEIFY